MADNIFGTRRNVDVVFCIDGTGSMAPCIESVKSNARRFHVEFVRAMTDLGSEIDSMRVKVIVFRDYHDDGEQAMIQSPFFELPTDNDDFERFLVDISANGGGDEPENGLEALYYAMKSDFTTGAKDRQVIVLFTDADALDLKQRASEVGYPVDMADEEGLIEMWACAAQDPSFKLRERNKRLVMFAPDDTKYKALKSKLNRSVFEPVNMEETYGVHKMINTSFKFYSVLKNEDANPYVGGNLLVVADGLGGSGSAVHMIDRVKHANMHEDVIAGAFDDMKGVSPGLQEYVEELITPMVDGKNDTSALWASRIVIARCVYALTEGEYQKADLSDKKVRAKLAEFIGEGLRKVAKKFDLQKGKYDGQLLLPTTLAFIRYTEKKGSVIVETVWAGDSRCYALVPEGLKLLSVDDEDNSGLITNLFYADNDKVTLNYICHEIPKPCVLMVVSDGIFDPFDPHENLGVEHTLLSKIKESNSPKEVATSLGNYYGEIRGDDATMAFVPLGFDSFEDMQNKLAKRTGEIIDVCKKQVELKDALEVMNLSEEEASGYVLPRTNDRFDYIVSKLVDMIENGETDIVLTPKVGKIVDAVKKDYVISAEKARKENRERLMIELYEYVKNNPECVAQFFVSDQNVDFGSDSTVARDYSS